MQRQLQQPCAARPCAAVAAALPTDKVRFVGDPIACVVAQTLMQANDAAEPVDVDIVPSPVTVSASRPCAPASPQLYAEAPDNIALDDHYCDAAGSRSRFAIWAAHVTFSARSQRVLVSAIEPRAAGCALPMTAGSRSTCPRKGCSACAAGAPRSCRWSPHRSCHHRHIGGSFGMKASSCRTMSVRSMPRGPGSVKWTVSAPAASFRDPTTAATTASPASSRLECRGELPGGEASPASAMGRSSPMSDRCPRL